MGVLTCVFRPRGPPGRLRTVAPPAGAETRVGSPPRDTVRRNVTKRNCHWATKKIRVYELARELGIDNHVVVELANELKIGVKSHSSSIDEPSADRVRRLADSKGLKREVVPEPEPEPAPPVPEPAPVVAEPVAPAPVEP